MPGKIKVKVLAGRNLPVMDRASDTTDAFVEIKFGGVTHKTDVCRKSLNPHWNSTEWHRFEVDESELQDEPLQLRLMDHDTYSANDAIGKVVISLAPLLAREANNVKGTGTPGGAVMAGWIPVFDTMHGIRGELNVIVKVELFSDFNKYKTSSVGVQFFHCPMIPPGYRASSIHGFVEELIVNDDPEYQWIDKIRTPRASNEARQVAFIKLSNQVQRLVGLKAAELGANAVVGYQQDFDLEGEAGVVARAIGTAVSITPLPTPSQPINVVCSQQQLKKCLDILATNDESVTDLNQYYRTHQDELQKMLSILNPKAPSLLDDPETVDDDDDKLEKTRAISLNSYAGSVSIYQDNYISQKSLRHLSEDQTDLNKLLNRNEDESSDSSGPIQKIKRIKKHLFSKKFSKRKGEKEKQDDSVSIQSSTSDTSRMSLADIKNELKKLKRLKKPKFRKTFANKEDEGEGMASILARSIIHVHSSLACIAETQDSESPNSTLRRTSESEPTINVADDKAKKISEEKAAEVKTKLTEIDATKIPEIHFSSLKNVSSDDVTTQERERRISESCPTSPMSARSENQLVLPGDNAYFGSVSSALSGDSSIYSSSDEEDESSDRSDTEDNLGTTTSIVENVLKQTVNPVFIAQMDRKLSILENVHPNVEEIKHAKIESVPVPTQHIVTKTDVSETPNSPQINKQVEELKHTKVESIPGPTQHIQTKTDFAEPPNRSQINEQQDKITKTDEAIAAQEPSTFAKESETCVKPHSHYIKIHNPFAHRKASKSISAPSSPERHSFVYRSSKRIKKQLLNTKNNMIKSLSHYSLLPKKKHENKNLSNPSSSSDVPSRAPSDTVLGSHFLSYSDLLNLDKEGFTPNKGLCKSDEFNRPKFSMYIGSEPVSRASISGPYFPYHNKDDHDHHRKERTALKPTGLIHTAMETILIDKVDTLLATSPDPTVNTKFFDDVSERLEEHRSKEFASKEAMGQVQSYVASTTPRIVAVTPKRLSEDLTHIKTLHDKETKVVPKQHVEDVYGKKPKKDSTASFLSDRSSKSLLDKMHSIIPKSSEAIHMLHLDNLFHRDHKQKSDIKSGGLVHTAMQTMLMDRAQAVIPDTPEPIPIQSEPLLEHEHKAKKEPELKSTGLIHTAMQTMLIDKVQSVMPEVNEPVPINIDDHEDKKSSKSSGDEIKQTGLLHSAFETILMDKVQTLVSPESEIAIEVLSDHEPEKANEEEMKQSGLIHTALETMLVDRAQALVSEPLTLNVEDDTTSNNSKHDTKSIDSKHETKSVTDEESHGLVHTAMETMLIDKIQTLFPETDIIVDDSTVEKQETSTETDTHENKEENVSLVGTAIKTMLIDQANYMLATTNTGSEVNKQKSTKNIEDNKPTAEITTEKSRLKVADNCVSIKIQKVDLTEIKSTELLKNTQDKDNTQDKITKDIKQNQDKISKKLIRQDSVHSTTEKDATSDMSSDPPNITCDPTQAPVLQHFHPILSGQIDKLETIPSVSETFDRSLNSEFDTNSTSVCGNSHAACDFDRSDRDRDRSEKDKGSPKHSRHESYGGKDPVVTNTPAAQANSSLNSTSTAIGIHHRRSSDSDLSVTPKGGSLNTSAGNVGSGGGAILKPSMNSNNLDMLEYPFLTMTEFPPGFIVHIGGTVCSRSVKLVDGGGEGSVRAAWWAELRTELRAHARALRCNAVLAYTDTAAICEDVCVLSASGTAAVINLDCDFNADIDQPLTENGTRSTIEEEVETCGVAHVPYSPGAGPYRAELSTCGGCRRARVPAVLLATCEKPNKLTSYSKAVTLTAVAGRARRAGAGGEPGARDVSDVLPFLEYELHKLLLAKLRMQGANAIFSLRTRIAIGERCVMAVASGTAFRLTALPPPTPPRIKASENDKEALEIQRALWDTFVFNKAANGYDVTLGGETNGTTTVGPLAGGEPPVLELCADKDACVLELDEAEDVETARLLCVRGSALPAWSNALTPKHTAPLAFVQVSRGRLTLQQMGTVGTVGAVGVERCVVRALDAAAYKLRRVAPAAIHTSFHLELPDDEIQLVVSGTAIPLADPSKLESLTENGSAGNHGNVHGTGDADDDIFELDEEQLVKPTQEMLEDRTSVNGQGGSTGVGGGGVGGSVSVTTLGTVGGAVGARRVCALRLLFVRETTAVRELGGLSGFLHTFTSEVLAIVRACTAALGGNALTSFYITQLMLQDNAHKNQGQCLLSVGGDVVYITY